MAGFGSRGGSGRASGGSSVSAGRKAKDRYILKKSKQRYKKSVLYGISPYRGPKRVKGSY
jgi:hypothetical protein